ncbi:MAG TPA: acetyl-CoA C-acetyltransferase [Spirochaetota bacterium]|nr:acetyl-CoA C-acetyltransferase [Spirochaetota bacterium]HOD15963.1 acetyl-CoA C-acetyltransferase [Spirochaetota bacterium]HPG50648.1 acetyl-CoA C-acetyltransferase [Spirochaetota bacterium]HPN10993.1 acetyl-CoA C-acetyltransferase [Spirochaetota bacterium]
MKDVVIVSGARTAIAKFGGALKSFPVVDLGALVIKEALKRAKVRPVQSELMKEVAPDKLKNQGMIEIEKTAYQWDDSHAPIVVDEIIMGNVLQAAQGQNTARQAMIKAGVPKETPAFTINKICGSGLKAIAEGAQSIMAGQADVIIAGGQENMSLAPMAMKDARWGYRMAITGVGAVQDLMVWDGLYEIFYGYHMGLTAENIAKLYGITRKEQDELGVLSHTRARKAIKEGLFKEEIVPVVMKGSKGEEIFAEDERPMDTTLEKMLQMKPAFIKDGTVTAGNASGINDAAAAVLMMSADKAKELGLKPLVKIKAFAGGGLDPAYMGLGPVPAVRKVLKQAGMSIKDLDMIELNEAFASQAIGCFRELGLDSEKANQLGSGISLGHPIGCTGARMMVTAMHEMKRKNHGTCLLTMCIGGGMGFAMIVEKA